MYQKDYILRMLEMLAELVAAIVGLIKKGNVKQASQKLDNAYYDFLKRDASFFRNLPKDSLTVNLLQEHNFTKGHLKILSELFLAEAELQFAQSNEANSLAYYEKALILFEFVEKDSKSFSLDYQSKISLIQEKINLLKDFRH